MPLSEAIRFRSLAAQLTDSELNQFLCAHRQQAISGLFLYIKTESSTTEPLNDGLSKIIESRKGDKSKAVAATRKRKRNLGTISREMVAKIASYLDQTSYFRFSTANRLMYLQCNTPNTLQCLSIDADEGHSYASIKFELYPHVTEFSFNLCDFPEYSLPINAAISLRHLRKICVDFKNVSTQIFDQYLSSNFMNVANVTHLTCYLLPDDVEQKFLEWLSRMTSLRYMSIDLMPLSQDALNHPAFSRLKGMTLQTVDNELWARGLLHKYAQNWDYLDFHDVDYKLSAVSFRCLEELKVQSAAYETICNVLRTARNLKKIRLAWPRMTVNQLKQAMSTLVQTCDVLEHVEICNLYAYGCKDTKNSYDAVTAALRGIQAGLLGNKLKRKNTFTIEVTTGYLGRPSTGRAAGAEAFVFEVATMVCWLEAQDISDFMLMWNECTRLNVAERTKLIEKLENLSRNVKLDVYDDNIFVITNRGCKINGYKQRWKMDD